MMKTGDLASKFEERPGPIVRVMKKARVYVDMAISPGCAERHLGEIVKSAFTLSPHGGF
jgi:hypothetical protein